MTAKGMGPCLTVVSSTTKAVFEIELIATTNQPLKEAPKRRLWYPIWSQSEYHGSFLTA